MLTRYFPSCALLAITVWSIPTQAQTGTPVLTGQYDNARTGANLNESVLNTSNVNPSSFGKLYTFPVDGDVIAQPLYWPGRQINGTTVNLLYVATAHNTVYAFDADDATKPPIWQVSLGPSVPGVSGNCPSQSFTGAELGILSTPVIDPTTATIYLTSATPATAPATGYIYRMIALDALTGQHKFGSPNTITASVPGIGDDAVSGTVSINTHTAMQRAALLLTNGTVYTGFASCGPDRDPYHGWILGYSASNVQTQTLVFNASPNGQRAGIWQSGRGLVADSSGAVYAMTGNGTWNGTDATMTEFGNSFIKLNGGSVVDWFTPTDWDALNTYDLDLGSSGPILLPQPQLLVGGGKEGVLYALDLASLGHLGGSLQSFQASTACGTFSFNQCHQIRSIAFWDDVQNPLLYIWATGDNLRAYRLAGRQFITTPDTQYPNLNAQPVMLSVSALRGTAGTGIVWALARSSNGTGTLYAFDAANVARQLYSSATNSARDSLDRPQAGALHHSRRKGVRADVLTPGNGVRYRFPADSDLHRRNTGKSDSAGGLDATVHGNGNLFG